jgi:hypothetical protein
MVFLHVSSHLVERSRKLVPAIEALAAYPYLSLAIAIPITIRIIRRTYAVMLRNGSILCTSATPNNLTGVRGVNDFEPCRVFAVQ